MTVAVFFGAHADDIELGAGGTCAKLCASGLTVHIVVATDERDPAVASTRRRETIAAAEILGVPAKRVHFIGLPDGDFRCNRTTVSQVRDFFSTLELHPNSVFTHTEADSDQDHVELTRIVKGALRGVAVFKYQVTNSTVPSHFQPTVSSDISRYSDLKSAALFQHKTQVILQRIGRKARETSEAFELEIQEGAVNYWRVLDHVNDVPFSRFWMPLCAKGPITIIAQSTHPLRSYNPACRRVPSDLQLVTQLQEQLWNVARPLASNRIVAVREVEAGEFNAMPTGASVILGGPFANKAALDFCARSEALRFRFDPTSEYLIDTRTGAVFEPVFRAVNGETFELTQDYGLLTISRNSRTATSESELVIAAMGVHAPGTAAVFSFLLQPQYITQIINEARPVIEGTADWAQWVIPSDADGVPLVLEIQSSVHVRPRRTTLAC